jgi:hypothetical protein
MKLKIELLLVIVAGVVCNNYAVMKLTLTFSKTLIIDIDGTFRRWKSRIKCPNTKSPDLTILNKNRK